RTLREHRNRVADLDVSALCARQSGRENVGTQQDLFVAQRSWNDGEVSSCIRDEQVFRPRTVDRVAEPPPAEPSTALRMRTIQAIDTLAAGGYRPDNPPVANAIFIFQPGAERFDDADRLVAQDQPGLHRVLATHDVHIGAADRGCRDSDDSLSRSGHRL